MKADCAAQRFRDEAWVPIQVKATKDNEAVFLRKYGERCTDMYGASPIVVVTPADGFRDPHTRAFALLREINNWSGTGFCYAPWMRENNDLFNMGRLTRFSRLGGLYARVREFGRLHPEYFFEANPKWRWN